MNYQKKKFIIKRNINTMENFFYLEFFCMLKIFVYDKYFLLFRNKYTKPFLNQKLHFALVINKEKYFS